MVAVLSSCAELQKLIESAKPLKWLVTRACRNNHAPIAAYAVVLCRQGDRTIFTCAREVVERRGASEAIRMYLYSALRWPEFTIDSYFDDPRCGAHIFFLKWLYRKGIVRIPTCAQLNSQI